MVQAKAKRGNRRQQGGADDSVSAPPATRPRKRADDRPQRRSPYGLVRAEEQQSPETRRALLRELSTLLGVPTVAYFTSFRFPVMMEDSDADMLVEMLQRMDLSKGLALVVSSPGGDGLSAERLVNVCRSYSGTGDYWVVVPGKAKSAATMVCFGASRIVMGPTSELGPIDPQLTEEDEDGKVKWFSVYNILKSYEDLFAKAVKEKGNVEPYLQQLARYDAREIQEYRSALSLSEDIAVKCLQSGMMAGKAKSAIRKKLEIFLTPKRTKTHGRPIYADEASKCGLNIRRVDGRSDLWRVVSELHLRMGRFVSRGAAKSIETEADAFFAPVGRT